MSGPLELHFFMLYDFVMFASKLKKKDEKHLVYRISILAKVFSFLFALILFLGFLSTILSASFTPSAIIPIFFCFLFLLAPFYRDDWTFDNEKQMAVYSSGIWPKVKREEVPYSTIERVSITHFYKGISEESTAIKPTWRNKEMAVLSIETDEDVKKRYAIEMVPARRHGLELERLATQIASFAGLNMETDKPALQKGWRG